MALRYDQPCLGMEQAALADEVANTAAAAVAAELAVAVRHTDQHLMQR